MIRSLVISLLLVVSLSASTFKERFSKAQEGDYIVTEQNKIFSLIVVSHHRDDRLVLEELSLPANLKKIPSWKSWYESGAPGVTSHVIYEFDLAENRISRCYSPTRKAYLEPDSFFLTLLSLPLTEVSPQERKRIGPLVTDGPDMRKIWSPPLFMEGKKISHPSFDVLRARWPADETPLSHRQIDLYFDKARPDFPFPCWLEIGDGSNTFKLRCVDTGDQLATRTQSLPSLPPTFLPHFASEGNCVTLTLDRSDDQMRYHLFAEDLQSHPQKTWAIPFKREGNQLIISKDNLKRILSKGQKYRWLLMVEGQPELTIEHPHLFVF